jgi:hypothetical protein
MCPQVVVQRWNGVAGRRSSGYRLYLWDMNKLYFNQIEDQQCVANFRWHSQLAIVLIYRPQFFEVCIGLLHRAARLSNS